MTAPSNPHFEPGQWVMCVEGARRWMLEEGRAYRVARLRDDARGHDDVYLEGVEMSWNMRRFRPATAAEIAAAQKAVEPSFEQRLASAKDAIAKVGTGAFRPKPEPTAAQVRAEHDAARERVRPLAEAERATEHPTPPPVHEQMRELRERVDKIDALKLDAMHEELRERIEELDEQYVALAKRAEGWQRPYVKDAMHPSGACVCAGEGECWWCLWNEERERATRAESALADAQAELGSTQKELHDRSIKLREVEADLARYREACASVFVGNGTSDDAIAIAKLALDARKNVSDLRAKYAALVEAAWAMIGHFDEGDMVTTLECERVSFRALRAALDALSAQPPAESAQGAETGELSAEFVCEAIVDGAVSPDYAAARSAGIALVERYARIKTLEALRARGAKE